MFTIIGVINVAIIPFVFFLIDIMCQMSIVTGGPFIFRAINISLNY